MSDIEFINIYSRRNHICNFPKQTLQHPLAICRALLFISQQLRHFSQTKHWSPHTFGHIVHKRYCISFILFPLSVWSGWVCLVAVALPWWPYWPSPSSAPLGWTLTDCAWIFPQGQGRRERTTAHTDTHRHTPPGYLGKEEHAGKRWRKDWCQHINTIGITRCIGMHRTVTKTERQHEWSHG